MIQKQIEDQWVTNYIDQFHWHLYGPLAQKRATIAPWGPRDILKSFNNAVVTPL